LIVRSHLPLHERYMSQVGPKRIPVPAGPWELMQLKKDPVVRHESKDPEYIVEARLDAIPAWLPTDMALADYECPHGKLPTDQNINCGCWGWSLYQLPVDLRERIQGLTREQAIAAILAV
jgi:hypothetical protein